MAFNGQYYLKVGNYEIPLIFMKIESYTSSRNVQDLDSYRDANGILHRNVLPHIVHKAEFETPIMTNAEFHTLLSNIVSNMTNTTAQDVSLKMFDEFTNSYHTGDFYMPGTFEFPVYNKQLHEPTRFAFIEY